MVSFILGHGFTMIVKFMRITILTIAIIGLHQISLGYTTQPIHLETNSMPIIAMPRPTTVSAIDTHQIYIPTKILPFHQFNGDIRLYDFDRHFSRPGTIDQIAFSLGGKLNALTDPFLDHFRLGATLYTAQSLGRNPSNPRRQDKSLPATPLTALGQAFIQYENPYLTGRIGDTLINTPWLNPADTRMIPATYQALYAVFAPWKSLNNETRFFNLIAFRQIRFKPRTVGGFSQHNLYNANSYAVVSATIPELTNKTDIGTLALGGIYKNETFDFQAWGYKFYDYSRIYYADFKYTFSYFPLFKPNIGAQVLHSPADGSDVIGSLPGFGKVDATGYGVFIGSEMENGQIILAWNLIPKRPGGFKNGDIVSPYTAGYTSDPLYTTSMTAGLVEKAAGSARKITGTYSLFDHQIALAVTGAQYFTQPFLKDSSEIDLDAIFMPIPIFKKSLSIRGRVGFANHTPDGKLTYSRLMIQYDFA